MINIEVFNANRKTKIREKGTIDIVRYVIKSEFISSADVNIIFVDDKRMIDMNSAFLNHRYTTDVISFPLDDSHAHLEGEVYINLDQARRQCSEYSATLKEECSRLIIHGTLHLMGYLDKTVKDKKRMTAKENYYLLQLLSTKKINL